MMVQDKQLVSVREAAEAVGTTEQTVRYWMRVRKIAVYKNPLGKGVQVDLSEIRRKYSVRLIQAAEDSEHGDISHTSE